MKYDFSASFSSPFESAVSDTVNNIINVNDSATTDMFIDKLVPYENQPFKSYSPEKLTELAEDIKANGVLSPIIVRPVENDKYQILAGHNRTSAAKLAGLTSIPVIIKENCDDDTAKLIVVNTNLNQRQGLLPSEKAYAYKMQIDAMKHQGITSRQVVGKLETADIIGVNTNESGRQIQRYIRLTQLIKPILDMIDDNKMPFIVGVNLSFLSDNNQTNVFNIITNHKYRISLSQSEKLKKLNSLGDITLEDLDNFFNSNDKEQKAKAAAYKIKPEYVSKILFCINSMQQKLDKATYNNLIDIFEKNK